MTSIVRIKRRHSQEPAEALLLATKRMKVEDYCGSSQTVEENIFRFCGTTENEVIFLLCIGCDVPHVKIPKMYFPNQNIA